MIDVLLKMKGAIRDLVQEERRLGELMSGDGWWYFCDVRCEFGYEDVVHCKTLDMLTTP